MKLTRGEADIPKLDIDKEPANDNAPKTPPRRVNAVRESSPLPSLPQIRKSLVDMYNYVAMFVAIKDADVAQSIIENAEECAESLIKLAEKNPAFKRTLAKLVASSAYAGVITAHMPILFVVAVKYVPALRDLSVPAEQDATEESAA